MQKSLHQQVSFVLWCPCRSCYWRSLVLLQIALAAEIKSIPSEDSGSNSMKEIW